MTQLQTQLVQGDLNDRIRKRLESLDVSVVTLTADGDVASASIDGGSRWIERLIVDSPAFHKRVRQQWHELTEGTGTLVNIWPGVWLAPLSAQRRRRASDNPRSERVSVALMIGAQWLESDQLHHICDMRQVDFSAAVSKADRSTLTTETEARRTAAMLGWMHEDASLMDRKSAELHGLSTELSESYEELSLLYKLATNMTVDQPPTVFLADACKGLQQVVGLRWLALQLIDTDPRLKELAGRVFWAGNPGSDKELLKQVGQSLIAKGIRGEAPQDAPLIVDDTTHLQIPGIARLSTDLLAVSLSTERRLLGVLYAGEKLDGTPLDAIDAKLCSALANSLSIFLENMMLYDDMQAMFLGTLHALTSAIDAKDSYTHGHSERVAMMSRQLAEAAGLSEQEVERVYIAGLIHDVGKIGVPESVLCKPGKLTDEEFTLVKMHPEIGARILADIRQMGDLIPGVLYHHERWDGRGYPHNKAGMDIPMFGRLICLADSFDAMSSSRTYRKGMPHERVIAEIARCSGTQFDPQLAKLFIELDFQPYFNTIERHQTQSTQVKTTA